MTYHQALGASFDPFAFAQQTATAVKQAADVAQKTAQAAKQVTDIFAPPPPAPAAAPAAAKRPFALMQPALMLRSLPRGPLTTSIRPIGPIAPSFGPSNLPPAPPADKDDDKDADKKSNTGMFIALGLAAVAAVVLLRKRG